MHRRLICPSKGGVWDQPENLGFEAEEIVRWLDRLAVSGNTHEVLDGEALTSGDRGALYGDAMKAAGTRYKIRGVFGSARRGGGTNLGRGVPALIVYQDGAPTDVYPHRQGDGYVTIRDHLDVVR